MNVENKNKVLRGVIVIAVIALAVGVGSMVKASISGKGLVVIENVQTANFTSSATIDGVSGDKLGATETVPTYLGADVTRQNDTYMYGSLEVAGTSYLRGTVNFSGDTRASSFVQTGAIAAFTVTTTATAANVCDSRLWTLTGVTTTPTITLPPTSTLFADCLTTNGDSVTISLYNASAATSTIIAAGTGGTLLNSSSATIAAAKGAVLTIVRDSATTVKAFLINAVN